MSGVGAPSGSSFHRVGEVTLHARVDGWDRPGPTVAYLHSLGCDLRIWDGVVARLPERRHLRCDLRGHGLSDAPPGPYAMADLARDVLGLLDAVGARDVVLVGISIGGMVALRAALEAPERVRALVACDTAVRIGNEEGWDARIEAVRTRGLEAMTDELLERWFAADFLRDRPEDVRGYGNLLARTPAEGYVGACGALRDEDLGARVADLGAPALVLCGAEDVSTPPDVGRALADALPAGRYTEIEGAAHLPCIERPDAVAERIGAFLREVAHA